MISSGTLSSVTMSVAWLLSEVKPTASRLAAVKVHFLHNHPSGDPTISRSDKLAFNNLFKGVPEVNLKGIGNLMGEFVVIDHGKFSYLRNGISYQGFFKPNPGMGDNAR